MKWPLAWREGFCRLGWVGAGVGDRAAVFSPFFSTNPVVGREA